MAEGIEFYSEHDQSVKHRVQAKRELIVAAGAVQSPKLLMLSGLGNENQLKRLNVSTYLLQQLNII